MPYRGEYRIGEGLDEDALKNEINSRVKELYFKVRLDNREDDAVLLNITEKLERLSSSQSGYFPIEYVVGFVQEGLDYDKVRSWEDNTPTYEPYEALYRQKGICDDKASLLAEMLKLMGYDVALFVFEKEEHVAVGVKCPPGYDYRETGYCFIESTRRKPIGESDETYGNGILLQSTPEVILITDGGKSLDEIVQIKERDRQFSEIYGDGYVHTCAEGKILMQKIKPIEEGRQENLDRINETSKSLNETQKNGITMGCFGTTTIEQINECSAAGIYSDQERYVSEMEERIEIEKGLYEENKKLVEELNNLTCNN